MNNKLILLTFFLIGCGESKNRILYVDPEVSSIYSINKSTFETFFSDDIKVKRVDSKKTEMNIDQLKMISGDFSVDARALIIINNDTLEANKFFLKKNEKIYQMNNELKKHIWY